MGVPLVCTRGYAYLALSEPVELGTTSYIDFNPLDTTILLNGNVINLDIRLNDRINVLDSIIVEGARMEMVDLRNAVDFQCTELFDVNSRKLVMVQLLQSWKEFGGCTTGLHQGLFIFGSFRAG